MTSVLLDRDHTVRTTNRIIPVIQEEARTPSPSPAFLNTVISITPATPNQSKVNTTALETVGRGREGEGGQHCF